MYRLSNRSLSHADGVDIVLIDILKKSIPSSPYDFGICSDGGYRKAEEQYKMFARGSSTKDGYIKKSMHQSGKAIDIYLYIDRRASWNIDKLEAVAKHIISVAKESFGKTIRWGGDWDLDKVRVDLDPDENFLDGGHFELLD